MRPFTYRNVETVEEAVAALGTKPRTKKAIAGGIDLLGEMKEQIVEPEELINLKTIPGLDTISDDRKKGLRIGALVTLVEIHRHATIQKRYPALAEGALSVGTPQIRNIGTIGGNLCQRPRCWYYRNRVFRCLKKGGDRCYAVEGENKYHAVFGEGPCHIVHPSDLAPPLVALDARVAITGPTGSRTIALDTFFTMPAQNIFGENILGRDEVVTHVDVPPDKINQRSCYLKLREKASLDFALASVAVSLVLQDGQCQAVRIVLGGAAPIPWRASEAETLLLGKRITPQRALKVGETAVASAEPLSKNEFKVPLLRNLIRRALLKLA